MNGPQIAAPVSEEIRYDIRRYIGKTKMGKLAPVKAVPFLGRESGMINRTISLELDPVAGRMVSQIFAEVTEVYVPIQAADLLLNDGVETAGITEILRRKIMDKETLFPLEDEGELTKRMGINPRSVSGSKKVSSVARIAHNVAVNHLRKRRYVYASLLEHGNTAVTPAIIHETVLDRFGAALDPDEHINGNVSLDLSEDRAPVRGIIQTANTSGVQSVATISGDSDYISLFGQNSPALGVSFKRTAGNAPGQGLDVYADLEQVAAGGFSLTDLYNAQKADSLIRKMREIAEANPEMGEDAILRWAFGLSADTARHPWVLYQNRFALGGVQRNAMDQQGMLDETMLTYGQSSVSYSLPIPSTELGGIVITFVQVTPDEVIAAQPHPILSDSWSAVNHAAEVMKLDPEPVTYRDVFSDISTAAEESQVKFYTGANGDKRTYISFGFNRQVNPTTVDAKTVMWQYAIPAGVTPENILYPETFVQYPFLDQQAEVVTYDVSTDAAIRTNMFFGPTPVEKLAVVEDQGLLE